MQDSDLVHIIQKSLEPKIFLDGTDYNSISTINVGKIAQKFKIKARYVEIAALENNIIPERYVRNMKTFSLKDQAVLLKSKVTVVGLGGLGGTVIEILAREGIGFFNLVDGDLFEDSNLNRQFLSEHSLIGIPKTKAGAWRISNINPGIEVNIFNEFLDENNAYDILKGSDIAIDCLDNLKTRLILESAAKKLNIPLVSAAIAGVSGHITTIFPEDLGLALIYGESDNQKGVERYLGCLAHSITILSGLECSEVIKILLKKGETLQNKLLIIDLTDNTFEILELMGA